MTLQEKYKKLRSSRGALLATNFYNFETLEGVLRAAALTNKPIILQLTPSSINYMGLELAVQMARSSAAKHKVETWIHLDHGDSYETVAKCLDAGFDSVMIDASEKALEENIKITRKVVLQAARYGACVEAELGYVAKLGQSSQKVGFTTPEEASQFIDETGIDALAIAIGTAHGFYKTEPKLDLDRLREIRKSVDSALVLHGSSGVPHHLLEEAIRRGINKINLATEIKNIFMISLKKILENETEIDLRKVFPFATDAVTTLVSEKLKLISNA